MNTTPDPNRQKLDRLLDDTLRELPELEAPENLLPNIMARVAAEEERQRLSWFARLQWPSVTVGASFVFFITYFSKPMVAYLGGILNTAQFAGEIERVNTGIQLLSTLGNACSKVIGLIPPAFLYGSIGAIFLFLALSCAGIGTAFFKITRDNFSIPTTKSYLS